VPIPARIAYTRDYLIAFEYELAKAKDSAELIAAMTQLYPGAAMGIALDIGAKGGLIVRPEQFVDTALVRAAMT
jgi:hypothetical protein